MPGGILDDLAAKIAAATNNMEPPRPPLQIDPAAQGFNAAGPGILGGGSPSPFANSLRQAYLKVTGGKTNTQAPLSAIRSELSDLPDADVDSGLLHVLQGKIPGLSLGQTSDPKALSKSDRAAAFSPGGEPFHFLWMTP